jgi:tRNA threonylcarbamoyladenosine biosynthesis protein TsaB
MLILSIRTDGPEAEVGLFENDRRLVFEKWQAHHRLTESIHDKIDKLLRSQRKELKNVRAVVVFMGPGSFTGLRIGISVANALADSLAVPVVGGSGDNWAGQAIAKTRQGGNDRIVLPEYGAPVRTSRPKH